MALKGIVKFRENCVIHIILPWAGGEKKNLKNTPQQTVGVEFGRSGCYAVAGNSASKGCKLLA